MKKWAIEAGADCANCPLRNQPCTHPEPALGAADFAVLGESPGKTEIVKGVPFKGASGQLLNDGLKGAGLDRKYGHITNTILCHPVKHMKEVQWREAIDACRPRLRRELDPLPTNTLVMVMGGHALQAIQTGTKHVIRNWRGYPIEDVREDMPAHLHYMPTYHPAFVLREIHHLPFFKLDLARGAELNHCEHERYKWPQRIHGDEAEVFRALQRILPYKRIAVDVENAETDPLTAPLLCIGLGVEDFSVTVTWPPTPRQMHLLRQILQDPNKELVYQNNNHDRLSLYAYDLEAKGKTLDTLNKGCVIASQVPHDLGTLHNWYTGGDRWKTKFHTGDDKKGAKAFAAKPRELLEDYNGKDCISTIHVDKAQDKDLARLPHGKKLYEESLALSQVSYEMTKIGIRMDPVCQAKHHEMLSAKAAEEERHFMALVRAMGLPEDFLKTDGAFIRSRRVPALFYDKLGLECRHFSKETGEPSLSKNALRDMMDNVVPEIAALARHLFMYRQWDKLDSTYAVGLTPNGEYIHPLWSAGTKKTRRWGSSPNMQNIPYNIYNEHKEIVRPGLRDMFIARDGMQLVAADYSALELRVLALLAQDEILLECYRTGKDVHDVNARVLFGVPDDEEVPKNLRRLAKNFVYGCNYGASVRTVFLNLLPDFPELQVELIEHMYNTWFEEHPWIVDFQQKQFQFAKEHNYVEGPYSGHRFHFYWGRIKPTHAINFPIQETAAHIINRAILRVNDRLNKTKGEHILLQVHDELVCEGPDHTRIARILEEEMSTELEYNGNVMQFPVEAKYGVNWEYMEDWGEAA